MKILSIIIPCFNVEAYLDDAVNSLVTAKHIDELDIIIVNDGSKDKTAEIASNYQMKYPNSVKCINKENGGHGSTINVGLQIAVGKYINILDGDDWYDTNSLDLLVDFLSERNEDLVISGHYRDLITVGKVEHKKYSEMQGTLCDVNYYLSRKMEVLMTESCYKTEILKNMGLKILENTFYVDEIYCLLPFLHCNTFVFSGLSYYHYRIGDVNQSMARNNILKRVDHKERVLEYICKETSSLSLSEEKRVFMCNRIRGLVKTILEIYYLFYNDRKDGKMKGDAFCSILSVNYPNIYRSCKNIIILYKLINFLGITEKSINNLKKII